MNGDEVVPTVVDPRVVAATLQMDTYQLSEQLVIWANEALPVVDFGRDTSGPSSLEDFDERVAVARRYLESAHEAYAAWKEDGDTDLSPLSIET